jgi:hypothetical protein
MPPRDFLSTLGRALNTRQTWEADIETRFSVVRPHDSRGLTVVRSQCNEQELIVSNRTGLTFAPGASVMVGSNTGRPGKSIIAGAPPGRMGASGFAPEVVSRTYGSAPVAPSSCPAAITGKSYLAIFDSGSELFAWRYTDGEYQEDLGSYDYTADGWSSLANFQRVNSETEAVVFYARRDGTDWIITWDIDAATVSQLDTGVDDIGGPIWTTASEVWFCHNFADMDGVHLTMYKATVGASGVADLPTLQEGTELLDATANLALPSGILLHHGGELFSVPSLWLETGSESIIPYFASGAWNLGTGRVTIAGAEDNGVQSCGYGTTGGKSIRVSYTTPGAANVGVMPSGPTTPEVAMLPADWEIISIENVSLNVAGTQAALFPVSINGEGDTQDQLLRLPVPAVVPSGCALNRITVEAGPEALPSYMLCRD